MESKWPMYLSHDCKGIAVASKGFTGMARRMQVESRAFKGLTQEITGYTNSNAGTAELCSLVPSQMVRHNSIGNGSNAGFSPVVDEADSASCMRLASGPLKPRASSLLAPCTSAAATWKPPATKMAYLSPPCVPLPFKLLEKQLGPFQGHRKPNQDGLFVDHAGEESSTSDDEQLNDLANLDANDDDDAVQSTAPHCPNQRCLTTLMVRNVPLMYTQELLVREWSNGGTYDFLYLPRSAAGQTNLSYAFINFVSEAHAEKFKAHWQKRRLAHFSSRKPLNISFAEVQGLEANLVQLAKKRVRRIKMRHCQPVVVVNGQQVDFAQVASALDQREGLLTTSQFVVAPSAAACVPLQHMCPLQSHAPPGLFNMSF